MSICSPRFPSRNTLSVLKGVLLYNNLPLHLCHLLFIYIHLHQRLLCNSLRPKSPFNALISIFLCGLHISYTKQACLNHLLPAPASTFKALSLSQCLRSTTSVRSTISSNRIRLCLSMLGTTLCCVLSPWSVDS